MRCCKSFLDTITRRKPWDVRSLHQTEFTRTLNVVELIGIGVGSSIGLGVFVMVAHVTKTEAGPAAVLSVLLASILALLSGLCHMELSTRLPRCGTSYTFCYVTLGELLSFVIGWSTILENALGGALATKAMWQYVEYMVNATNTSNITQSPETTSSDQVILISTPDVFPCCLAVAVVFLGFVTLKRSALINLVLTCMSGLVVIAFICVGFLHVQAGNWNSQPGFFSEGLSGIIAAASLMMFVFAGIDNVASCVEETKSPSQTAPNAFGFTFIILSTALFLVASALTLSTPWHQLADNAALARAYEDRGIYAANYVIGVGAVLGLVPVVMGSFIHPVRVLYAMSEDCLMPKIFSKKAYNGVPIWPHFLTGLLITLCALLLDFTAVLEMVSIATIIHFMSSSIILLFIRYQPEPIGICREYSDLDANVNKYPDDMGIRAEKKRSQLMIFANGDCKVHHEEESSFHAMSQSKSMDSFHTKNYALYPESPQTQTAHTKSALHSSSSHLVPSSLHSSTAAGAPITFFNRFKSTNKHTSLYDEQASHNKYASSNNCEQTKHDNDRQHATQDDYESMQLNVDFARSFGSLRSLASSVGSSIVALSSCDVKHADEQTWKHTRFFLLTYVTSSTCMTTMLWVWPREAEGAWWAATLLILSLLLMIISSVCIARKPQNNTPLYFKTPYAPLVPLLAITGNMALLAALPFLSWLRFALWLLVGLFVYCVYSHRHSLHQSQDDQEEVLFDISQLNSSNAQVT